MTDQQAVPRNVVVVLLDSLNRHMLGAYGSTEFDTPNLDRFARGAVRFDRHYSGSLPCMPARHDILVGALDFLWRPWGSIEAWESALTHDLRRAGVTTMLVSDHPHLFETGGENYHTEFTGWDYVRGHESDAWRTAPDPSAIGAPLLPRVDHGYRPNSYHDSRTWFRDEQDFPGPRTMSAAASWLRDSAPRDQRFLLFVDEFDPHEPFDTPDPWATRYDDSWEGPRLIWPPYAIGAYENGVLTERAGHHIRANYGAKLSMIDAWFGRLLDELDASGQAEDTAVVVCTDHGHYLGDRDDRGRDLWGKPGIAVREPLAHTPLLIRWPGQPAGSLQALTTNVDLHATLADVFGVTPAHRTHGRSLLPLLTGQADSVRDWALTGVYGRHVSVVDGDRTYARSHDGEHNAPLSMWSNRWSTMPVHGIEGVPWPLPDDRAWLDRMPGSTVPVIRQPFQPGDMLPYWAMRTTPGDHALFDLTDDPAQTRNLSGVDAHLEGELTELLRTALVEVEAPQEQLARLGIA